jgi:hypothetical protein
MKIDITLWIFCKIFYLQIVKNVSVWISVNSFMLTVCTFVQTNWIIDSLQMIDIFFRKLNENTSMNDVNLYEERSRNFVVLIVEKFLAWFIFETIFYKFNYKKLIRIEIIENQYEHWWSRWTYSRVQKSYRYSYHYFSHLKRWMLNLF